MRRDFAGVTVELPWLVVLLETDRRRPVFHRPVRVDLSDTRTGCGRPIFDNRWETCQLPVRHALRFARPCRQCWPQIARNGQIELELERAPL